MIGRWFIGPSLLLLGLSGASSAVLAQEDGRVPTPHLAWSFAGPFGRFDPAQLRRGYQVYREVCSNCHAMRFVAFRNLVQAGGPMLSAREAATLAAGIKVLDGPNEAGEMIERPGRLSDPLPSPFPNEQAARAANGGALPPDMSLLAKARPIEAPWSAFLVAPFTQYDEAGPDYIHAVLTGYADPPPGFALPDGTYYNRAYPGHAIAMPPPLSDGQVAYADGSPATVDQYARDAAAFLMWAADPHLDQRKRMGLWVPLYLVVLAGLLYALKRRIWAGLAESGGPDLPVGRD